MLKHKLINGVLFVSVLLLTSQSFAALILEDDMDDWGPWYSSTGGISKVNFGSNDTAFHMSSWESDFRYAHMLRTTEETILAEKEYEVSFGIVGHQVAEEGSTLAKSTKLQLYFWDESSNTSIVQESVDPVYEEWPPTSDPFPMITVSFNTYGTNNADAVGNYLGFKIMGNYDASQTVDTVKVSEVPEPATLALLGSGCAVFMRRRKNA
ncbi:PEP-CTERM sorting domain-containing protein [Sedimentisphaera salicampi]|uniref:PEP-CTERM sorting domain-containing protein n=1 Tax=Sedimentisphaera salicampi TaxID=1941349 RepID=A0A1W6LQC1_9BACT|nr:PEP-CTERM sorting domain-containing protein [Sedimentisphaera salicampi]ARN57998.1 PEP-CTERM sorting domain-containing protein [Sedimentisphaera salicampi]